MTNSMIEKAARALAKCRTEARNRNDAMLAERGLWPDRSHQPTDQEYVRAVLSAIREPNEAMLDLGADADGWRHPSSDYISAVKRATVMWRTMIDSILKEGT